MLRFPETKEDTQGRNYVYLVGRMGRDKRQDVFIRNLGHTVDTTEIEMS